MVQQAREKLVDSEKDKKGEIPQGNVSIKSKNSV
jgi:hypothetical protein